MCVCFNSVLILSPSALAFLIAQPNLPYLCQEQEGWNHKLSVLCVTAPCGEQPELQLRTSFWGCLQLARLWLGTGPSRPQWAFFPSGLGWDFAWAATLFWLCCLSASWHCLLAVLLTAFLSTDSSLCASLLTPGLVLRLGFSALSLGSIPWNDTPPAHSLDLGPLQWLLVAQLCYISPAVSIWGVSSLVETMRNNELQGVFAGTLPSLSVRSSPWALPHILPGKNVSGMLGYQWQWKGYPGTSQ